MHRSSLILPISQISTQVPADIHAVTSSSAEEMGFDDRGKKRVWPVVEVEEGRNATLECRAGGIPVPKVTWVSLSFFCFGLETSVHPLLCS